MSAMLGLRLGLGLGLGNRDHYYNEPLVLNRDEYF